MRSLVAALRHTLCRARGVVEVTRRLPEHGYFRAPFATCGRCGLVLRCLLSVAPPPPPMSAEERALIETQEQMAAYTRWLRYGP